MGTPLVEPRTSDRARAPNYFRNADEAALAIVDRVGKRVHMAVPLALGKPITLLNALYRVAKSDPGVKLTFVTSLHLEPPFPGSELERRLLGPFIERMWGQIPAFEYMRDIRAGTTPPNFQLQAVFIRAGAARGDPVQQQGFVCSNYTQCIRDAVELGSNVTGQIVAERVVDGRKAYSMSCSADTHKTAGDLFRRLARQGDPTKRLVTCEVNRNLPFMWGTTAVDPSFYDLVLDDPGHSFPLFATPKEAVTTADHLLGLYDSMLVPDGGTLQIGIGSLGDATAYALKMRQVQNEDYRKVCQAIGALSRHRGLIERLGGIGTFEKGVLGSSEMLVDGFLPLVDAGVVKRRVYEHGGLQRLLNEGRIQERFGRNILEVLIQNEVLHPQLNEKDFATLRQFAIFRDDVTWMNDRLIRGSEVFSTDLTDRTNLERVKAACLGSELRDGVYLYAAFFAGPQSLYQTLRDMPEEKLRGIRMEGVDFINQLYGQEELAREQRIGGRFMNTGLVATVTGAIASDSTEDNQVLSGVGGQYNFVSMAHALPDGRSVINVRSWRQAGKQALSNIVWQYPSCTIPRHLRDLVVTEYGIADLRGQPDAVCITRMIEVADSRFQAGLVEKAKEHGKIPKGYTLPDHARYNTPDRLAKELEPFRKQGMFPAYPLGGPGLTEQELVIAMSLKAVKEKMVLDKLTALKALAKATIKGPPAAARPFLERMGLEKPKSRAEKMMRNILVAGLLLTNVA